MHDAYAVLGVSAGASETERRAAYRRAVRLHHPDHNHGSVESARRFEAVQDAWAEIRRGRPGLNGPGPSAPPRPAPAPAEDGIEARLAAMERELQVTRAERER